MSEKFVYFLAAPERYCGQAKGNDLCKVFDQLHEQFIYLVQMKDLQLKSEFINMIKNSSQFSVFKNAIEQIPRFCTVI